MTKRLLNLHTIQKITLILTTLLLLLPITSWATKYTTINTPKSKQTANSSVSYYWSVKSDEDKIDTWTISASSGTVSILSKGFTFTPGSTTLTINNFPRPSAQKTSCRIRKVIIEMPSYDKCSISIQDSNNNPFTQVADKPGEYTLGAEYVWGSEKINISITNITAEITINSISVIVAEGDDSSTFSWPATISGTDVTFNNDKNSLTVNARDIQNFSFPLNLSVNTAVSQSRTVTYSSSDEDVATVDENGDVTIKKIGNSTITATLQNNDDYYYSSTKSCYYTLDVEFPAPTFTKENGTYSISDNIYFNYQGTTDNMPKIKYKWNDSDEVFDYTFLNEPNIKDGTITAWAEVTNQGQNITIKSEEATATYLASYITIGTNDNKTEVTSQNADNISGSGITGNVSYNIAKNTLSLNGATISDRIHINSGNGLTIEISGTNVTREIVGYGGENDNLQIIKKGESSASLEATTDRLMGGDSMEPIYHFSSCTWDERLYLNPYHHDSDKNEYILLSGVSYNTSSRKFQHFLGNSVDRVTFCETQYTPTPSIWLGSKEVENGKFKNDEGGNIPGISFDAEKCTLTFEKTNTNLKAPFQTDLPNLTVKIIGDCNINAASVNQFFVALNSTAKIHFTADEEGRLNMTTGNSEFFRDYAEGSITYDNLFQIDGGYSHVIASPRSPILSSKTSEGDYYALIDYDSSDLSGETPFYNSLSPAIKYSFDYADAALTDISNQAYPTSGIKLTSPGTLTAWIEVGTCISDNAIGKYFGFKQNPVRRVFDGTNPVDVTPELTPAITEEDAIIQYGYYDEPESENVTIPEDGTKVYMINYGVATVSFWNEGGKTTILNLIESVPSLQCMVQAVPSAPTIDKTAGEYLNTEFINITSTASSECSIMYSWGNGTASYYSEAIPMQEGTLNAWVKYQANANAQAVYSDTISIAYTVKKDINNTYIREYSETAVYTGAAITPSFKIAEEETSETAIDASNYEVSYAKIVNDEPTTVQSIKDVGEYQIILTAKGNTYGGKKVIPFTIEQADFANVAIDAIADQPYTGEDLTPTIVAKLGDVTLARDEYTISYTIGEDAATEIKNFGTYTATLTSTGKNFTTTSTKTVSFNITKATITPTVTLEGWTYGATGNEPSVTGNSGSGDVTYTYKPQHAAEEAYSATKPTNAGDYTVKASIAATANYEAASDSAHFTISKAAGGLTYSAATASAELNGNGWAAPELSNPNNLSVTYTSSNTAVATINETGVVTLAGTGETTIKAASDGDANHEASEAQYVLTVSRGKALGYGVWVGETEVDEDNYSDILGDGETDSGGEYTKAPSFVFNPEDNTLLVINSDAELNIESRIPELNIHLSNDNKLKKVFYNNQGNSENTGKLLFTCDSNFPGSVTIGNTVGESAISGFASVSYEFNLQVLKPAKAKYANGQMTDSLGVVADTITVGVPLEPIKSDEKEELNADDFTVTNPDGSTATVDLSSTNVNNIYYTLPESTEGQGYDPETNTISVVDPMTDEAVEQIAAATTSNSTTVGSNDYAENFIGLTFIVQGGEGVIRIDQETEEGYEFHLKIGDKPSIALKSGKEEIEYSLPDATYCWLYLVRKVALARGYTRVSKRDRAPGNVRLVKVQSKVVASTKSAAAASGGTVTPTANLAITGIVDIDKETPESKYTVETVNDKWYTIDGRKIDKPTQKGLYIRNRKKIVVK